MGDRLLSRTVWQDRRVIFEHLAPPPTDDISKATGKWLKTQPKTRSSYLPWISYANTDILQASGAIVLCCPTDLVSYSAMAHYDIRQFGKEEIFRLRPAIGTAVHMTNSPTAPWDNEMILL